MLARLRLRLGEQLPCELRAACLDEVCVLFPGVGDGRPHLTYMAADLLRGRCL